MGSRILPFSKRVISQSNTIRSSHSYIQAAEVTPITPVCVRIASALQTRGNALLLIIVLGIGGSFQSGYHSTELSSPSPVRCFNFWFILFSTCSYRWWLSVCLKVKSKKEHSYYLIKLQNVLFLCSTFRASSIAAGSTGTTSLHPHGPSRSSGPSLFPCMLSGDSLGLSV